MTKKRITDENKKIDAVLNLRLTASSATTHQRAARSLRTADKNDEYIEDSIKEKKQDDVSAFDLSKKLVSNKNTITKILNNLQPLTDNENMLSDPQLKDSAIFEGVISKSAQGNTVYISENSLDAFAKQYNLQYRDPSKESKPSGL